MRRNKFNAKPTVYNGVRYASKAEAAHAARLDLLKSAKGRERVVEWEAQWPFELWAWGVGEVGRGGVSSIIAIYKADFRVRYADGHIEVHEVKGYETPLWKLKRKIFEANYPHITLKVIK
jgi:hypothetical protein